MMYARHKRYAILYLIALGLAVASGWYMAATDMVAIQVINSTLTNHNGVPQSIFHVGDEMVIHREFCLTGYVQFVAAPSLIDEHGVIFPLASGVYAAGRGCKKVSYGIIVPDLPEGKYTLRSTFTYQNGPLNQDTQLVLPLLNLEVRHE